jgi:hypothetical protein
MRYLAMLMFVVACNTDSFDGTFVHSGEYTLTWERMQTTCSDAPLMPDLVYVGQYPDNYPDNLGGKVATSFYYSTVNPQAMSAADAISFGSDDATIPDFDMKIRLSSEIEHLKSFTFHFKNDSIEANIQSVRDSGCTTHFHLTGVSFSE